MERFLSYYTIWISGNSTGNSTSSDAETFDEQYLAPAEDVSVDAVVSSLLVNSVIFVFLMVFYECLRCLLPEVYSSRKRINHTRPERDDSQKDAYPTDLRRNGYVPPGSEESEAGQGGHPISEAASMKSLPDASPFDWIGPVFGIPWSEVRKSAGLDGYFFLRYIRMMVRITCLSTIWFFLILVPTYATGKGDSLHPASGWYILSARNLASDEWRMWVPVVFAYLFSSFIGFVIKQEYKHFLEIRQDFLARGTKHVHPQHHYSVVIENIPYELRSDRALKEYFENLFPGRVHSASVVLNLPDLEEASVRCTRSCRRLEKSIAHLHATGKRPTHIAGRGRINVLGIDLEPVDFLSCTDGGQIFVIGDDHLAERPMRGTRVDSISYYTQELAAHSRTLFRMQGKKAAIADSGNVSLRADNWFDKAIKECSLVASKIMDDSAFDNDLRSCPSDTSDYTNRGFVAAERMTSMYGSFSPSALVDHSDHCARTRSAKHYKPESVFVSSGVSKVRLVRCLLGIASS
jgi:hypothetical protein